MPNSMHWFRRNQKVFLATLCFLCIVGFVLFEPLFRMFTGTPGGANPVAVRMNFADLHEHELSQMVQSRAMLNRFLETVAGVAATNVARTGQAQLPPQQIQSFIVQQMQATGVYAPEAATEQGAVRLMLMTHEARQLGMEVSDEAAVQWLQRATLEQVSPDQLKEVIGGMGVSQRRIFDELRSALLAANIQEAVMHVNSMQGAPPGLRWDYFQRLNREARAEVIALPVADFVGQVGDPTESALTELFEKHKNEYPIPGQPRPGFRVPVKGKFQGFKALYEQFATGVEVTDEEIAKYYDEHKENFPYTEEDPAPAGEATPGTEGEPATGTEGTPAAAPESTEPASTEATPEQPASTEPPAETEPAAPPESASETPASEPTTPTEPAAPAEPTDPAETPTEPSTPAEPEAGEPSPGGGGDDAGSAQESPATETPAAPPADASAPTTETATEAAPAAAADATTPAASATPPAEPVQPSPEYQLPEDIAGGEKPQYDPLWKVTERIRELLVREKVQEKIGAVFDELSTAMDRQAQKQELYEIEKEEFDAGTKTGEAPQPPAPLDFKALAQQHGVESFETGLISPFDASAVEIGQTTVDGRPFTAAAFDSMGLLTPRRAEDLSGDQFLFWKTESSKAAVPEFKDAREEVVAAWKQIEARKLAEQQAAKMAESANGSGQTLAQMFGADTKFPVRETSFFTWMTEQTLASQFGQPRVQLGVVPEVPNAGQEFMRATFALQPGQAGSALDAPESTAYVIRMIEQRPETSELLTRFGAARYQTYATVAQLDLRDFATQWIDDLESEANLTWERPPHNEVRH